MPTPSEQQTNAVTTMEQSEAQLRERINALRDERRAEALGRHKAKTEADRQRHLERMAARLERESGKSSATVTASSSGAKRDGIDRTAAWKSAIKRAQGDEAAPVQPSAKRDGIDRAKLWRKAIKGE